MFLICSWERHDLYVHVGTWPGQADLKEYLLYSAPELEESLWFTTAIPDGLQLRHAYALYHLLRTV